MKIIGVGPKTGIQTSVYFLVTIITHYLTLPFFTITFKHNTTLILIGIILILSGSLMLIILARKLQRSFNNNILMTYGLYKFFRNPMYAMYILFILPGLALLFNSWLVITSVIIMYILLRIYIREEYEYLEAKYGDEYRAYLQKVWVKFL